jgi:hypothetical protein
MNCKIPPKIHRISLKVSLRNIMLFFFRICKEANKLACVSKKDNFEERMNLIMQP